MRKLIRRFKARTLVLSISAISANMAFTAIAQAQDEGLEEIQITGSRIRTTDGMAEPTPVTAITSNELSSFDPGGTVAEQLDSLPQFFGTQTAQRGGGALFGTAGGSFLDMRNLGPRRTLVLLDGSRIVPADKGGSVNVDTLPSALIRTVDVVTGGASAAYGADALGGVTNFILDRQFQGFKVNVGTGITEQNDGQRYNVSLAGGRQFGERLNVIASFDAKYINQIERNPEDMDPDFFQRWGWVGNPAYRAADPVGTNPQYLIKPWVTATNHSPYGLISAPGTPLNRMKFTPDGSNIAPFVLGEYATFNGQNNMSGGPEAAIHNRAFGAGGVDGAEVVGRSGFLGLQYELTDNIEIFGQIMVGRSESNNDNKRGRYELESPWTATVFRDNAFLPANVAALMDQSGLTSFQMNKVGSFWGVPEIGDDAREHNVFSTQSWSVGFNADLNDVWSLTGNWQKGESMRLSQVYNLTRVDRMFLGMDAVRNPTTGAIQCRVQQFNPTPQQLAEASGVKGLVTDRTPIRPLPSPVGLDNSIRDCVPYNVMGNGNISQAAIDYIGTDKFGRGYVDQDFAELLLTGELHEGWGYGPIGFAGGLNWRDQSVQDRAYPYDVDELGPPRNSPEIGIQGIPAGYAVNGSPNLHMFSTVPEIQGQYDVWEWFSELSAPIWESGSGDQSLGGSLAFRQSDYSTSGKVDTWKLGLELEVFQDLRLRATKSRDVREATFAERFDQQGSGGTVNDPTRGGASSQITSVAVGTPTLDPEFANTVVAGFVYQPSFFDGFQISTDWYEVKITDAIAQLGLQRVVNECAASGTGCQYVERDPTTGLIGRVFNPWLNVASALVEGVDVEMSYRFEPDFIGNQPETFTLRALAGHIIERSDVSVAGAQKVDITGGVGTPENRITLTSNYGIGPWNLQLQGRWIDATTLAAIGGGGRLAVSGVDFDDATISSNAWFNAQIGYTGEFANGSVWNASLNVQNLFDRNPPVIANYGSRGGSQTISDNYDAEGRRYQLNFNYSF